MFKVFKSKDRRFKEVKLEIESFVEDYIKRYNDKNMDYMHVLVGYIKTHLYHMKGYIRVKYHISLLNKMEAAYDVLESEAKAGSESEYIKFTRLKKIIQHIDGCDYNADIYRQIQSCITLALNTKGKLDFIKYYLDGSTIPLAHDHTTMLAFGLLTEDSPFIYGEFEELNMFDHTMTGGAGSMSIRLYVKPYTNSTDKLHDKKIMEYIETIGDKLSMNGMNIITHCWTGDNILITAQICGCYSDIMSDKPNGALERMKLVNMIDSARLAMGFVIKTILEI